MCAGILLLCLLVYWPAVHGQLLWDDPAHVTRPELREWDGLRRIWFEMGATQQYYPVLHTAFWLEHRLWGDSTIGYHLTNILLHAANCCLLALLLRSLWAPTVAAQSPVETPWRNLPRGTEWLAALLLAVHPVCVESVAWISEQKNTLSAAFALLAAWLYWRYILTHRTSTYLVASGVFLLALGSKTVTATLPAAILVILWWKHGNLPWKRAVLPIVPWFAAAIGAGLLTSWVERTWIGAEGSDFNLSFLQRGLLAARVFWFYLGKVVWPADLTFFYPRWDVPREAAGWSVYLMAGLVVTAALWLFRRRSRGPLAVWLLFGGMLFPALGFFDVFPFRFSYVADHFQYLATFALIAGAAAGLGLGARRLSPLARWGCTIPLAAVGILLVSLSRQQSRLYEDDVTLFRANIAANPTSWMGHQILAQALSRESLENRDEAIALYRQALAIQENPNSHYKLGYMLTQRPETWQEGIEHFREALQLRPDYPEALNSFGVAVENVPGRLEEAIGYFRRAVELRPDFAYAHCNLAEALSRVPGKQEEAVAHFETALSILPDYAAAHYLLANVLASMPGRQSEAVPHYEAALRIKPSPEAHVHLANLLVGQPGRLGEAIEHYQAALRLAPGSAWIHYLVAVHLGDVPGHHEEALARVQEALRLRPDYVEAHNLLGVFLARMGNLEAAREEWNTALRIDPSFQPARNNLDLLARENAR